MAKLPHLVAPAWSRSRGSRPERHALLIGRTCWALSTLCCRSVRACQTLPSPALQGLDQRCHLCGCRGPTHWVPRRTCFRSTSARLWGQALPSSACHSSALSCRRVASHSQCCLLDPTVCLARPYCMPHGLAQPACKLACGHFNTLLTLRPCSSHCHCRMQLR